MTSALRFEEVSNCESDKPLHLPSQRRNLRNQRQLRSSVQRDSRGGLGEERNVVGVRSPRLRLNIVANASTTVSVDDPLVTVSHQTPS
jgi:hypothetical protein